MPIDASIYQGIAPTPPASPLQTLSQIYALKGEQQKQEVQRLTIEDLHASRAEALAKAQQDALDAQQKREEDQAILGLYHQADGQPLTAEQFRQEPKIRPERAFTLLQAQDSMMKSNLGIDQDRRVALAQQAGGILQAPAELQQSAYTDARAGWIKNGWAKPEDIPETFSPGWVRSKMFAAQTPKEQWESTKPDPKSFGPGAVYDPNDPEAFKKPPLLVVPEPEKAAQTQEIWLDGKNVPAAFVPLPGGKYKLVYNGEDVTARAEKSHPVVDPLTHELLADRAAAEKAKLAPLNIDANVRHTASGNPFVDMRLFSAGPERDKALKDANAKGVFPANGEQVDRLIEIGNARDNQQKILDTVTPLLATSPGTRPINAATMKLSSLLQTNEQVAAFNVWQESAIQTLRALAGSKGLRIDKVKLDMMLNNSIKLTDTVATAQQRFKNITAMLDSAEGAIINLDQRDSGNRGAAGAAGAGKKPVAHFNPVTGELEAP